MVARFVAVGILSDQSRDVGRGLASLDNGAYRKERVQFLQQDLFASEAGNKPSDVVGRQPRILPGIALAVVVGAVRRGERAERCAPASFRVAAPHEARLRVEIVAIGAASSFEEPRIVLPAQRLGSTCRRAVCQSILHIVCHCLVHPVAGDVTILFAQVSAASVVHCCFANRLESLFAVEARDLLHNGVRHDGNPRISHHAVGLVAPEVPHREASLLVGDRQHRLHNVGHPLRM